MRDDDTDELVVQEDFVLEELVEELVPQVDDFRDTAPMDVPHGMRMATSSEWPPTPPLPADLAEGTLGGDSGGESGVDFAQGTIEGDYNLAEERTLYGEVAPVRRAAIYAAVRRPTTSSDDT